MPSSMIFAGLVVIWLLILVPAVARHRQEVARPTTAALSGRVLERPQRRQNLEVDGMDEVDQPRAEAEWADHDRTADETLETPEAADNAAPDAEWADDEPDDYDDDRRWERPPPRYRPGRGGFDPEAAALTARARYAFRQRVVVTMLVLAIGTAAVAAITLPILWSAHAAIDIALIGYLVYLRRQVRMEEAIRERRAARMAGTRRTSAAEDPELDAWARRGREAARPAEPAADDDAETAELAWEDNDLTEEEPQRINGTGEPIGLLKDRSTDSDTERALPRLQPAPTPPLPAGTALVQSDEEDPDLHDLDSPTRPDYRRAAGE